MPNANYVKGRAAEYHTVKSLRSLGWESQRSAASHGIFDVYGLAPDASEIVLIQCKRGEKPSPCEYKSAVEWQVMPGVTKLVLWFYPGDAPRILYCNREIPAWCGLLRWLALPPKQMAMRLPEPRMRRS